MNYEEFTNIVMNELKQHFGLSAEVSIRKIMKNNSLELDGMTVMKKGEHISPTIYLNRYYEEYENGLPFEKVIERIIAVYEGAKIDDKLDLTYVQDYDQVRDDIVFKLVHYEKNRKLLDDVPHFEFLNMAIVFCHLLRHETLGHATMLIHNAHMEMWNVDQDELYRAAKNNTPRLLPSAFCSMQQMMRELFVDDLKSSIGDLADAGCISEEITYGGDTYVDEFVSHMMEEAVGRYQPLPMYVLTNESRRCGAAAILYEGELDRIGRRLGEDFYILPSSIHEVIIVPMSCGHTREELRKMVKEINITQVSQEEYLSDHVYIYYRKIHEILM